MVIPRQPKHGPSRLLILETKRSILTASGRTPDTSGYWIYRAVVYEGLRGRDDILEYPRSHGVEGV